MKLISLLFLCVISLTSWSQNLKDSKGMKQGAWSKTYPNSRVYQYKGQFKNDKPIGTFSYYYPSSKVKAIIKHSETTNRAEAFYYHETGILLSYGIYRDMKKDSIWLNFGPSGRLSNSETYKNDKLNGKKTIYYVPEIISDKSQIVSAVCYYTDDKLNGEWLEYFNDGMLKVKGAYSMDIKIGVWIRYHTSGKKMTEEKYKNGNRHGWCYAFDSGGKQVGKEYYFEGKSLKGKALDAKLAELKQKGIDPNE